MPAIHGVDILRALGRGIETGIGLYTQLSRQERIDKERQQEEKRAQRRLELAEEAAKRAEEAAMRSEEYHQARMGKMRGIGSAADAETIQFQADVQEQARKDAILSEREAQEALAANPPASYGAFTPPDMSGIVGMFRKRAESVASQYEANVIARTAAALPEGDRDLYLTKKKVELEQREAATLNRGTLARAQKIASDYKDILPEGMEPEAFVTSYLDRIKSEENPNTIRNDLETQYKKLHEVRSRLKGWKELEGQYQFWRELAKAKDEASDDPTAREWTGQVEDLIAKFEEESFRKETDPAKGLEAFRGILRGDEVRFREAQVAAETMKAALPEVRQQKAREMFASGRLSRPTVPPNSKPRDWNELSDQEQTSVMGDIADMKSDKQNPIELSKKLRWWAVNPRTLPLSLAEVRDNWFLSEQRKVMSGVSNGSLTPKEGMLRMAKTIRNHFAASSVEEVEELRNLLFRYYAMFDVRDAGFSEEDLGEVYRTAIEPIMDPEEARKAFDAFDIKNRIYRAPEGP